jgi:sugar transferase (PEP-CTERM/EpsH1 system associated)
MSKVCVVSQRVPFPPNKGEKLRTYHQIERLVHLGHDVEVLTLQDTEADTRYAQELATKLAIKVQLFPLGSKVARYAWALTHRQPISVGAFYSASLQEEIDRRLFSGNDALLLTASSLSYYILESENFSSSKCHLLMDFMDVDSDKWAQYAGSSSYPMKWVYQRESKGIRKLEAASNRLFDQCFLIAKEETELFEKEVDNSKPIMVLGNGLDFDAFYPAPNSQKRTGANFLFTGVMDYKPNIDAVMWFIKCCWPSIRSKLSTATFTIGGMNPVDEIKALHGVEGVEVTGFVEDILPYFHNATVFVAPFRIARGVQNKVLQAAACRLPIVTTPMGAEGIAFASDECMWIENDENNFVKACLEAIENEGLAKNKANKSFDDIRSEYSWQQQLYPLEQVLNQL